MGSKQLYTHTHPHTGGAVSEMPSGLPGAPGPDLPGLGGQLCPQVTAASPHIPSWQVSNPTEHLHGTGILVTKEPLPTPKSGQPGGAEKCHGGSVCWSPGSGGISNPRLADVQGGPQARLPAPTKDSEEDFQSSPILLSLYWGGGGGEGDMYKTALQTILVPQCGGWLGRAVLLCAARKYNGISPRDRP